jgi:hypothetical protein
MPHLCLLSLPLSLVVPTALHHLASYFSIGIAVIILSESAAASQTHLTAAYTPSVHAMLHFHFWQSRLPIF